MKRLLFNITVLFSLWLPSYGQGFNVYTNPAVENTELYKAGNKFQKDMLLFYDMLKETHPYYADMHKSSALEKERTRSFRWAEKCTTYEQFSAFIQSRLSRLEDGHTTVVPEHRNDLIYPLSLYFRDASEGYVKGISTKYSEFSGKQIRSINGMPTEKVLKYFRKRICYDNEIYFLDNVAKSMQDFHNWEGHPCMERDSSLTLVFTDNSSVKIYPQNISGIKISWAYNGTGTGITSPKKALFYYEIKEECGLCYLQFNAFMDRQTEYQKIAAQLQPGQELPDNIRQKINALPRFDEFMETMFRDINRHGIKTLVIDLRNNKGGNSILGDILLSWLKPAGQTKDYHVYTRLSDLWGMQYPAQMEQYRKAMQHIGKEIDINMLYDGKFLTSITDNQAFTDSLFRCCNAASTFDGNVIFIQGRSTYSSAGMLLTKARDNGIGIIAGEYGSFSPSSYGEMLSWKLPNTGIRGYISCKYFQRPDESIRKEKSLEPDVIFVPSWEDLTSGKDVVWEWLSDSLDKK